MAVWFAVPIALYGFVIAATWIDTIADSLVSLLNFIGIILSIPSPVLGLTLLAWGNSMSDLSANITMARKGLANMAITACFAGPTFNILVGLGLGFSTLAAKSGTTERQVTLSSSVVTGFLFVALNTVVILSAGLIFCKGRIVRQYGYISLTLYAMYVVTSIGLQYSKYGDNE
jgi:sodium/potassium/calcium exchanger 6